MKKLILLSGLLAGVVMAQDVKVWEKAEKRAVSKVAKRHSIHTYFNLCPESPDGKSVLFYASEDPSGAKGYLVVQDRASGKERIIARDIETEDAHRAACQQWVDGGKTVIYHNFKNGKWIVLAIDMATGKERVLAENRQLTFAAVMSDDVPMYGCHWNPAGHRDLEIFNLKTGKLRTVVKADDMIAAQQAWVDKTFTNSTNPISIFFPVVSPDNKKVFFKLARGIGGDNFRNSKASIREGKFVCDLETGKLINFFESWGHPSWSPDSTGIIEKGNFVVDIYTRKAKQLVKMPTDHPSFAPDGKWFVSDGKLTKKDYAETGKLVVVVGSTNPSATEWAQVDYFKATAGAKTWRKSHPHPVFSADGKRIYYNVNEGDWTELRVAELKD